MNAHNSGQAQPTGSVLHLVTRDLGQLKDERVGLRARFANFIEYHWTRAPKGYGVGYRGGIIGALTFSPQLTALHYRRPIFDSLEMTQKLRRLLDANVDVRELCRHFGGVVKDCGVLSTKLVTDAGVNYLVDALQNLTEPENFKFHGYGTGTTAEAATDTALVTELTTQYATDNTRPTGSQTEGASANIYRTVATLSPDSGGTIAITEHGIFSQAATGGGTLLDRSKFAAINIVAAQDSLQTTYDLTIASGG